MTLTSHLGLIGVRFYVRSIPTVCDWEARLWFAQIFVPTCEFHTHQKSGCVDDQTYLAFGAFY